MGWYKDLIIALYNSLPKEVEEVPRSKLLEDYYNKKYPIVPIFYNGRVQIGSNTQFKVDVRDFFTLNDQILNDIVKSLKLSTQTDNQKAVSCLRWVIENIPYKSDTENYKKGEFWCMPFETLSKRSGDCLKWNTKLYTESGPKNIEDIYIGEKIIGKNGEYKKVVNKWDKGFLKTKEIILNNGSSIVATDEHKFILSDGKEVRTKDIKIGDILKQINNLNFGETDEKEDPDYWKLVGLFVSDGWADYSKSVICISGKDGCKKEAQKEWVKEYCIKRGIDYYWNKRYILIKSKDLFNDLKECGGHAIDKHIHKIPKNKNNIISLLDGLKADSYTNKKGTTTFGTISEELKNQIRVLYRVLGFSVHTRLWQPTKTQFGKNPIWRIVVRGKKEIPAKVVGILESDIERVYDIEVEGNEIYLPENDVLVHNCEDLSILLANLMIISGIPSWKIRLVAGYVFEPVKKIQAGHVYITFFDEVNEKWVILDSCYYPNLKRVEDREEYKKESMYQEVWFSWNDKYSWNTNEADIRKMEGFK